MTPTPSWADAILRAARAIDRDAVAATLVDVLTRAAAGESSPGVDLRALRRDLESELDHALRAHHGTWPSEVVGAARAVLRCLPAVAGRVDTGASGRPPDAARIRSELDRLGAAATEVEPPATGKRRCPRCGSGRINTERDSSGDRYLYEHHCLACGYIDTEEGDVTLGTAMSEFKKRR